MITRLYHADKTVRQELAQAVSSRNGFVLATQIQGSRDTAIESRLPFKEILECSGSSLDLIVLIDEGKPEGMWRDPFGELCDRLFPERRDASAATAGWVLLRAGQAMAYFRKALWDPVIDAEEITAYLSRAAPTLFRAYVRPKAPSEDPAARRDPPKPKPKKTPVINPAVGPEGSSRTRKPETKPGRSDEAPARGAPRPRPAESPRREEPAAAPGIPAVPALDPWMVLGIHKGAHLDMARKAYRALVIQYHPDKVASLAPEFRKIAEERTREINLAWAMLEKELGG